MSQPNPLGLPQLNPSDSIPILTDGTPLLITPPTATPLPLPTPVPTTVTVTQTVLLTQFVYNPQSTSVSAVTSSTASPSPINSTASPDTKTEKTATGIISSIVFFVFVGLFLCRQMIIKREKQRHQRGPISLPIHLLRHPPAYMIPNQPSIPLTPIAGPSKLPSVPAPALSRVEG